MCCARTNSSISLDHLFGHLADMALVMTGREDLHSMLSETNKPRRVQAIELLRILAAYGIVAFHSGAAHHNLAYSGLIIFLVLSPMLDLQFNRGRVRSFSSLVRSLLVPWAFWMVIYGLVNLATHRPFIQGTLSILSGTSLHLWYLPYIFVVLVFLNLMKARPWASAVLFWSSTFGAATLLATVTFWRPISLTWILPIPQWIHAAAPVLVGVVFGLMSTMGRGRAIAVVILAIALVIADLAMLPGIGLPYTVGIGATALVALFGSRLLPPSWTVQPVAACMLGVYLCHALVLKIVQTLTGHGNYVTVTLSFAAALFGVWTIRRFIPASKIVLG
jgi:hypothetical protein